uniref:cDNA sequence AB124611 n=1 Tax=Mus musculus TaxID=10090 RepID=G8JL59_MOUSE
MPWTILLFASAFLCPAETSSVETPSHTFPPAVPPPPWAPGLLYSESRTWAVVESGEAPWPSLHHPSPWCPPTQAATRTPSTSRAQPQGTS